MSSPVIQVENLGKAYRIGLEEEIPDTFAGAVVGWVKAPLRNWQRLRRLNTFRETVSSESSVVSGQETGDGSQEAEVGGQGSAANGHAANGHASSNGHPTAANGHPANPQFQIPNPQSEKDTIWALRDVSFDVHEGEVVGIIGRNGAGKSTLLKILSRITEPTTGRVTIRGRVSSLLEVGTGFHPELTGRENVYMNGTILGMTKREIDRKFDEIVDFSGVEKFLDTPVKRYSSGMKVRLAFAVAAHLEPEILIIDEVLAVGDAEFQNRCLGKMQDVAGSGRTVLFVSHNMAAVRKLTSTAVYLQSGRVKSLCDTDSAIREYLHDSFDDVSNVEGSDLAKYRRSGSPGSIEFMRVWATGPDGRPATELEVGDDFTIHWEMNSTRTLNGACLSFRLLNARGDNVVAFFSEDQGKQLWVSPGVNHVSCTVRGLPLAPGTYLMHTGVNTSAKAKSIDRLIDYPAFKVRSRAVEAGHFGWENRPWGAVYWQHHEWCFNNTGAAAANLPRS